MNRIWILAAVFLGMVSWAAADSPLAFFSANPPTVSDRVLRVQSATSRDLAEFRSDVAAEDVNIAVTSNAANSSSGLWLNLIGQGKGAGLSVGTVPGLPTELSFGVGSGSQFWQIMTGSNNKLAISDTAPVTRIRPQGYGFGGEPSTFFHLQEASTRTNAAADVLRIDTNSPAAQPGFGGGIAWYANGQKVGALYGLMTGTNSGRFDIQVLDNGVPRTATSWEPTGDLLITVGGALKMIEQGPVDSGGVGYRLLRVPN